jgi:hypothetical protein
MPIIASHTFHKRVEGGRTIKAVALDYKRFGEPSAIRFILRADHGRQAFGIEDNDSLLAFLRAHAIESEVTGDEPEAAWPYPFQIGDLVELKSGGHRMVVTGLQCSEGTCGDPYKGELRLVEVAWSIQSQMDGDDISREELDPRLLQPAVEIAHERTPC